MNDMKIHLIVLISAILFAACSSLKKSDLTLQPTLEDYQIGEQWVWKYKGVTTAGDVRSDGTDTRTIVRMEDGMGMTIENDTIPLADIVMPDESDTPKYDWPLEVGKTWTYENNWTSQDGTTGTQNQQAEVLSFQEETVEAGTFMAYTIQYTGRTTNSRGYDAEEEEIWVYAPAVKTFIKLTQSQGEFLYVEELIEYSKPN